MPSQLAQHDVNLPTSAVFDTFQFSPRPETPHLPPFNQRRHCASPRTVSHVSMASWLRANNADDGGFRLDSYDPMQLVTWLIKTQLRTTCILNYKKSFLTDAMQVKVSTTACRRLWQKLDERRAIRSGGPREVVQEKLQGRDGQQRRLCEHVNGRGWRHGTAF